MDLIEFWPVIILAVAISIDGLSVGVTYGLRNIKIGIIPLIIISGISVLSIYLTSSLGSGLSHLLDEATATLLGSIILVLIGCWLIYSAYLGGKDEGNDSEEKLLFTMQIKSLGIIIKILKEPTRADFDRSGTISVSEALFLGLALALDALGAGLGAGLTGFSNLVFPMAIGFISMAFVSGGFLLGRLMGNKLPGFFEFFPGLIIIVLGIIKLL